MGKIGGNLGDGFIVNDEKSGGRELWGKKGNAGDQGEGVLKGGTGFGSPLIEKPHLAYPFS